MNLEKVGVKCLKCAKSLESRRPRRSFSCVKLMGDSRGSKSWVILVSQTHGSKLWVQLVRQTPGVILRDPVFLKEIGIHFM